MRRLTRDLCQMISVCADSIDELDEGSILAEELYLIRMDVLATWRLLDCLEDLGHIFSGFGLVDILELDVHLGLRFHIGQIPRQWQTAVLVVKGLDGVSDDPKARLLPSLKNCVSVPEPNFA